MKKPNPHFMDRKVTYRRRGREADAKDDSDERDNEKPKAKLSRKQRIEEKRRRKVEHYKEKKKEIVQQLGAAQHSTKSMGKFDRKAHQQERKLKIKKRKDHSSFSTLEEEVERNMEVLGLVRNSKGSKKVSHSL